MKNILFILLLIPLVVGNVERIDEFRKHINYILRPFSAILEHATGFKEIPPEMNLVKFNPTYTLEPLAGKTNREMIEHVLYLLNSTQRHHPYLQHASMDGSIKLHHKYNPLANEEENDFENHLINLGIAMGIQPDILMKGFTIDRMHLLMEYCETDEEILKYISYNIMFIEKKETNKTELSNGTLNGTTNITDGIVNQNETMNEQVNKEDEDEESEETKKKLSPARMNLLMFFFETNFTQEQYYHYLNVNRTRDNFLNSMLKTLPEDKKQMMEAYFYNETLDDSFLGSITEGYFFDLKNTEKCARYVAEERFDEIDTFKRPFL